MGPHVVFLRSRVLGEGAGIDLGRPGHPTWRNFGTIFGDSLRPQFTEEVIFADLAHKRVRYSNLLVLVPRWSLGTPAESGSSHF